MLLEDLRHWLVLTGLGVEGILRARHMRERAARARYPRRAPTRAREPPLPRHRVHTAVIVAAATAGGARRCVAVLVAVAACVHLIDDQLRLEHPAFIVDATFATVGEHCMVCARAAAAAVQRRAVPLVPAEALTLRARVAAQAWAEPPVCRGIIA